MWDCDKVGKLLEIEGVYIEREDCSRGEKRDCGVPRE